MVLRVDIGGVGDSGFSEVSAMTLWRAADAEVVHAEATEHNERLPGYYEVMNSRRSTDGEEGDGLPAYCEHNDEGGGNPEADEEESNSVGVAMSDSD